MSRTITVQKEWTTEVTFEIEDDEDTNSSEFCEKVDAVGNEAPYEWSMTTVFEGEDELWNV